MAGLLLLAMSRMDGDNLGLKVSEVQEAIGNFIVQNPRWVAFCPTACLSAYLELLFVDIAATGSVCAGLGTQACNGGPRLTADRQPDDRCLTLSALSVLAGCVKHHVPYLLVSTIRSPAVTEVRVVL